MRQPMTSSRTIALALGLGLCGSATAFAAWTPYVSEEGGGPRALCPGTVEAVRGFDCNGNWCDSVSLSCGLLPYGITVGSYHMSPFFSEEDSGVALLTSEGWYRHDTDSSHVCNFSGAAGVMTGIRCSGSYCDQISVECATPTVTFEGVTEFVEVEDCFWTDPISEENPPFVAPPGHFITGVDCSGWYCDNKSFHVCRMLGPSNSCMGECGGVARSGDCFCDDLCTSFGDCCSDYEAACVPF